MEELRAAVTAHLDQVAGLVQALSSELRRGIGPAADNLRAFIRAVDWTEPWLMCLMAFHVVLLLTAVGFRRNANFQLFLLFLASLFRWCHSIHTLPCEMKPLEGKSI
uniref:Transmembrane protein 18 n=1 Tax=Zea mays TaxID=4577 RepID=A0A804Q111_MAIZE